MATAFNDPDQWRQATEPRGAHRDTPLSADEKRAVGSFVEESDEEWERRLRERDWQAHLAERRVVRQAEDDQANANLIVGGSWS